MAERSLRAFCDAGIIQQHAELEQRRSQNIVVVVRHSPRQLTHRLHLLDLQQLGLQVPAVGNITDIALDYLFLADLVHVADKLHLALPSVLAFKRQVLVPDIAIFLQGGESGLGSCAVFEEPDLPEVFSQELLVGIAQHIQQERIRVGNLPRAGIKDQDAVLGRLKKPPVSQL